jgi:hypothetical protein
MSISPGNEGKSVIRILVVLIIAAAGGCAPRDANEPLDKQVAGAPPDQAPLAAHRITIVPDLPVPADMKIKEKLSTSFEGAGTRMVDYTYDGLVDMRRVYRFYIDQMPLNRWQLLTDNYTRGVHTLTYQKGRELCTVTIQKTTIFWTRVRLQIQQPETGG